MTPLLSSSILSSLRDDYCNILYHGLPKSWQRNYKGYRKKSQPGSKLELHHMIMCHTSCILFTGFRWGHKWNTSYWSLCSKQFTERHQSMSPISFNRTSRHIHCGRKKKDYWWNLLIFFLETFGRRSFSYAAPHAWNKLPVSLKTMSSFPTFFWI